MDSHIAFSAEDYDSLYFYSNKTTLKEVLQQITKKTTLQHDVLCSVASKNLNQMRTLYFESNANAIRVAQASCRFKIIESSKKTVLVQSVYYLV